LKKINMQRESKEKKEVFKVEVRYKLPKSYFNYMKNRKL
jgi:hypothetical protein